MDSTPGIPQQNRRLAAIMFLDMVGYSAMMSKDEARALACVGELEKLLRAEIPRHGGRLVKFLGDGSMAEFPTALSSVTCSLNVLSAIEANNAWIAPENRYAVRIGLHLGELVDVQDDIFSDTVNVAARIQPLADPGGIAMSSFLYSQIKNQLNLKGTYLPPQKLKNIPEKIRIFLVHPQKVETAAEASTRHRQLAVRVAVGVVLFLLGAWLLSLLLRK
ncbi:MAG: adenylate/guanylate cyclase domain-containing protein [Opitutae bacterium]|nr:adenylate/guanylate cyclase domain-containing protein [Opitutae bacterium]